MEDRSTSFSESRKFNVYDYEIDPFKSIDEYYELPRSVDFLHLAIPFSDKFIDVTMNYAKDFKLGLILIHSTVALGTTRKVYDKIKIPIAYTPVRGKYPNIKRHFFSGQNGSQRFL